ncbi:nucleotide-binding alpha-beta plait domain-containing protein [Tanacetum coccineum]
MTLKSPTPCRARIRVNRDCGRGREFPSVGDMRKRLKLIHARLAMSGPCPCDPGLSSGLPICLVGPGLVCLLYVIRKINERVDEPSVGQNKSGIRESEVPPALVLNNECLLSKDLSKSLLGRVKQFVSLANLRKAVSNERFVDIKIQYMGELWVLLEFGSEEFFEAIQTQCVIRSWFSQLKQATMEFTNKGRIAWMEVEGIPLKLWTDNTFKQIATKWGELLDIDDQEEMCFHLKRLCIHKRKQKRTFLRSFQIYFRGKDFLDSFQETPGWVPDFMEENDEEEQSDVDSKEGEFKVHDTGIYGGDSDVEEARETLFEKSEKKENNLDEEHKDKQEKNSEDPFNIYKLLKKKNREPLR